MHVLGGIAGDDSVAGGCGSPAEWVVGEGEALARIVAVLDGDDFDNAGQVGGILLLGAEDGRAVPVQDTELEGQVRLVPEADLVGRS